MAVALASITIRKTQLLRRINTFDKRIAHKNSFVNRISENFLKITVFFLIKRKIILKLSLKTQKSRSVNAERFLIIMSDIIQQSRG